MGRVYAIEPKADELDGSQISEIEYPFEDSALSLDRLVQRIVFDDDVDEGWATVESVVPEFNGVLRPGDNPVVTVTDRVYVRVKFDGERPSAVIAG